MEVLFPRCAGFDVHKDTVVACVRCVTEPKAREVRNCGTTTRELLELSDWLAFSLYARRHGGDGRVLEASLAPARGSFKLVLAKAQHIRNVPHGVVLRQQSKR